MAIVAVDSEALDAKSAEVRGTIDRLQSDINRMQSGLQSLSESWQGQASANFQSLIAEWRSTQAKVEESLASINQALGYASVQYAETEAANVALFRH